MNTPNQTTLISGEAIRAAKRVVDAFKVNVGVREGETTREAEMKLTDAKLRTTLEDWGFWLAIEGREYSIFESHRLLVIGSRADIMKWVVATKRDREIGWVANV